jgi:hypothetical protein
MMLVGDRIKKIYLPIESISSIASTPCQHHQLKYLHIPAFDSHQKPVIIESYHHRFRFLSNHIKWQKICTLARSCKPSNILKPENKGGTYETGTI